MRSKPKSRKEKAKEQQAEVDAEFAAADAELDKPTEDPPEKKPSQEDRFNDTCDQHEYERAAQPLHANRPVETWTLYKMLGDKDQKLKTFYCQDVQVSEQGTFIGKMFRQSSFGLSKYYNLILTPPKGSYLKFEGVLSYREYLKLPEEDQTPMLPYIG